MSEKKSDFTQGWDTIYVPSTPTEHALFYVTFAINLTNVIFIVYALCCRSYLPIKAKNVWITSGIGIGSTIFNVSYNVVNGMVGYQGWLEYCRMWSGWFMVTLGLGMFQSFINLRLIIYYRVFISRRTHAYSHFTVRKFLRRYWPFFALWFPSLLSSIVIYVLPSKMSARSVLDKGVRTCDFDFNYIYWIFAYYAAQVIVSWVLYFRMRRIAKAFNEFRTALATLLIFTAIFAMNLIVNLAGGTVHMWGRVTLAFSNALLFNSYFWLILGPPIVGHMFSRDASYRKFLAEMHEDGLIAQEARLGNAHKQLYGVTESTDNYMQASGGRTKTFGSSGNAQAETYAESISLSSSANHVSFNTNSSRYIV
ncbi:hypothetical protein GQ54DRAFT_295691 [Martensiomyces pterosporus]|nr:hypothetical protein GQ54DRAFT_295691 [Martensiomyces pterosporus]